MKTGLQCTSSPRRLRVQAISSKAERMIAEAPFLAMTSWMRPIFSEQEAPVRVSSRMKTGDCGKLGRPSQSVLKISSVMVSSDKPFALSSLRSPSASWWEFTQPSIPTLSPSFNTLPNHSPIEGVSGKRSLKRLMPVSAYCSSAWMK